MKIVILDADTIGSRDELASFEAFGEVEIFPITRPAETKERIEGAAIVLTNKVRIDAPVIDACPTLKLICVTATGTNNIDIPHAEKAGIVVKNVAGYATESVAQFTFTALLHLISRVDLEDDYVRSGGYHQSGLFTHFTGRFHEIRGKKMGIIGLGTIGRRVAEIAQAFGAEVIYYSTSGRNTEQPYRRVELDELLERSDFISINAPLNDQTVGLLSYEELRRCKGSAILINTGRGGIVNENHLARALDAGELSAAAIDVFAEEPLPPDSPLLRLKDPSKILLSPHNAWTSREARHELIARTRDNIAAFIGH